MARGLGAIVAVIVAAGDHGVAQDGVSAYPPEVTPMMVMNFLADTPGGAGGAAVNAIARTVGAKVYVMDAGVNAELPEHPDLVGAALRRGTHNLKREAAMTPEETEALILAGAALAAGRPRSRRPCGPAKTPSKLPR
mgnify:CR=1 FL=1